MQKPKIAISIGDLNGIGLELAVCSHEQVCKIAEPIYLVSQSLLSQACKILGVEVPKMNLMGKFEDFVICPSKNTKEAGESSFASFVQALDLAEKGKVKGVVTLPISKEAWRLAGLNFKGHTDYLWHRYKKEPIMMLGCQKLFVGLFCDHVPIKKVPDLIKKDELVKKLYDFCCLTKAPKVACLGLNPHAGENGVLGTEDFIISEAIKEVNKRLKSQKVYGAIVPDSAFSPKNRQNFTHYFAMYHDQGLIPLKALYFEESINVSLNIPVLRSSVDHGTAFDIAYKNKAPSNLSYLNALKYIASC